LGIRDDVALTILSSPTCERGWKRFMVPDPSAVTMDTYSFALFIPRLFFAFDAALNRAFSTGR
jgi:hypothetical protein